MTRHRGFILQALPFDECKIKNPHCLASPHFRLFFSAEWTHYSTITYNRTYTRISRVLRRVYVRFIFYKCQDSISDWSSDTMTS